jgi:hypothetical protein
VLRHNAARNVIYRAAASGGLNPDLEKAGLLPPRPEDTEDSGLRRPADVYIPSWDGGVPAAFDLAITSPHRAPILREAARSGGAAANQYEITKKLHLNTENLCRDQGISFIPLVAETSGGWGPSGLKTITKLAKRMSLTSEQPASLMVSQLLESLCTAIRRANARAVLKRSRVQCESFSTLLTAADILAAAEA